MFCLFSRELGNSGQVIYCLQKAMRADPTDVDAKWDCASLYAELNDFPKAIDCLEQLLAVRPGDVEICKMVAKVRLHLCLEISECILLLTMWRAGRGKFLPNFQLISSMNLSSLYNVLFILSSLRLSFFLSCQQALDEHGHHSSYFFHLMTSHSSWDVNLCLA